MIQQLIAEEYNQGYEWFSRGSLYFSVLQMEDGIIYDNIYVAKYTKAKGFQMEHVAIISELGLIMSKNIDYDPYTGGTPWAVQYKEEKKAKNRYYYYEEEFTYTPNIPFEKLRRKIVYCEEAILKRNDLKYCAFQTNGHIHFIDYIPVYKEFPICEMLMKLKLYKLILNKKGLKVITENKEFRKYLFNNSEDIANSDLAFQTTFNAFKKHGNPADYANSLRYRIHCGKQVSIIDEELKNKLLKYTSRERLIEYFEEENITNSLYNDYIKACEHLKLNLKDTKVLFPKEFMKMHDDYCAQYNDSLNEKINKDILEAAKKYEKLSDFKDNSYSIFIAKRKSELINEGSKLNHCVGRMGYDKKIAGGSSLILFLRKNEEKDQPYLTVEFNLKTKSIVQKYGKNNVLKPESDTFLSKWQSYARKCLKEINV